MPLFAYSPIRLFAYSRIATARVNHLAWLRYREQRAHARAAPWYADYMVREQADTELPS